jgi:hypothetical protein
MRVLLAALLLLAACGPCPTPAAPAPTPGGDGVTVTGEVVEPDLAAEPTCAYGWMMVGAPIGEPPPAYEAARKELSAAFELGAKDPSTRADQLAAANHFMACTVALRAIPDGDPVRDFADGFADVCYYNAMGAFATAGRWTSEGKARFEQAVIDDPRMAQNIRVYLEDPLPDC